MKMIDGGVLAAKGYQATGAAIGIKEGKKDLALLKSEVPAVVAAAFTTNEVKATSVLRNIKILKENKKISGIVANSGNANACTGSEGVKANQEMAEAFAKELGVPADTILTASTGVIGARFPIEIIKKGIHETAPLLGSDRKDALLAAESIMTTDTYSKEVAVEIELSGKLVHIGGMAKGSGMICPNMATMLAFVTTDAVIEKEVLQHALSACVPSTFNMVSVDGDTSTNDTIVVLANGMAQNDSIQIGTKEYTIFYEALHFICETLAKDLVRDGEGATKFIEVNIYGAKSEEDAKILAKSVVKSSLVKTAIFGADANWGRVLAAMGYAGVTFNPEKVDIVFSSAKGKITLMNCGTPIAFDEEKAKEILLEKEIRIDCTIQEGQKDATAWGCDLSYEYVKINGDYRS